MQTNLFQRWKHQFCRDAAEDEMALFSAHMRKHDLPDEPESLLKGTIMVVSACCAYLNIDGRPLKDFLAMQTYHPINKESVIYTLTFNLFDRAYARILTSKDLMGVDIADLHHHPWNEFESCGFTEFIVSRTDGNALSKEEIDHIDQLIEDDLRYDFTEEEVGLGVDAYRLEGSIVIDVYDQKDRFP